MAFIILNQKLIKLEIAGKNPIAAGNFSWIFARDCEGTEQLQAKSEKERVSREWIFESEYGSCRSVR